jgi:hypothetical protein
MVRTCLIVPRRTGKMANLDQAVDDESEVVSAPMSGVPPAAMATATATVGQPSSSSEAVPEYPSDEQLDEDEAMLRALRIDLPGTAGAPSGIIAITCTARFPKKEFIRCSPNTIAMNMVDHAAGMEVEFHAVAPKMVEALVAIDIYPVPYKLYQIITADGGFLIMAVKQADADGGQNEWTRSKEITLAQAQKGWVRPLSDKANGRYRCFPAPPGRFPEPPVFPDFTWSQIVRLAFTARGRLISSPEHPLYKKWAGRDGGDIG